MTFDEWYDTVAKYVNGADIYQWMHETWIAAQKEAIQPPDPPPECKTKNEKIAFAFGWWKAMEQNK